MIMVGDAVMAAPVVMAVDTGAFAAGRLIGAPGCTRISPNKLGPVGRRRGGRDADRRDSGFLAWTGLGRCPSFWSARFMALVEQGGDLAGIGLQAPFRREGQQPVDPDMAVSSIGWMVCWRSRWLLSWQSSFFCWVIGMDAIKVDFQTVESPRRVTILGSTGSVGCNTVDLIERIATVTWSRR